ncbi:MAG: hypothetical protein HYS13_10455 [Planctomycetia bacterium]|nr:hypothetical protein [Planctomycetia bacterium]
MMKRETSAGASESTDDSQLLPDAYGVVMSRRSDAEIIREMQEHGGQLVARSLDGRTAHVYANSPEDLDRAIIAMGLRYTQVVIDSVPRPDEGEQL